MAIKKQTTTVLEASVVKHEPSTKKDRRRNNLHRQNNIHLLVGVILVGIGLYQLRNWILGLLCIILGILFITGYFQKKDK